MAIEKFTFALSFDDADNVIRSAGDSDDHYELGKKKKKKQDDTPPPPPAIYTEEQATQMVAEAEQKAHAQGHAEGHAQGLEQGFQEVMASVEKAIGDVESVIAEKLGQIDEQQKRANAKINEDAIHVALGVIRKLAPAWSKQYQLVEIEDIIRQCLANLFDAPKVMIKVNPELEKQLGDVAQRIADSRGFSGKVVVVGEPDVAVGDCMVSWGDGTAVRDSARVWAEINGIVDNALALHASEHDLPKSDMGDPKIQATPAPAQPPAKPIGAAAPQAPAQTAPQTPPSAPQNGTSVAPQQRPAQQPAPQNTGHPQQVPAQPVQPAATPSANTGQGNVAPPLQAPRPQAANPAGVQSKEGNGTNAQNVQTSTNNAMPRPDNSLENRVDQAQAPAPGPQSATGPASEAKPGQVQNPTGTQGGAQAPSQAGATQRPTGQGSSGQTPGAVQQPQAAPAAPQGQQNPQGSHTATASPANPADAEKMAAVKQPTKDAGDENG
ncbi:MULTISPECIES: FliH/SctL family protein [Thalassospira]|uniref:Uncharacterized protein n=2 Tax=Thalassospira TaxID=168934 RepID=A0A367W2W7_9PROT|nr:MULTISPECIES: FliH/SctL family protein [Thalassospira]MDG4718320.1 FliH/SctL family protein [Thalassospira sp. FZY0004]RCK34756.1 hypothetical protein TH19_16135 [Thalassospira profundimaris]